MPSPGKQNSSVLIIDDDADVLHSARMFLKQHFQQVDTQEDPTQINSLISQNHYGVVMLDMNFRRGEHDGREGLYWLERIREIDPKTAVILITAYGDIELAVEAMRLGAANFVLKPWKNQKLLEAVEAALSRQQARGRKNPTKTTPEPAMVGQSEAMLSVFDLVRKVAPTEANVLILGENGTGKDLVAQAIHRQSARKNQPFVRVDAGALTATLFESELFGHVKGAFTDAAHDKAGKFEQASGGTLFLDEIGNLSLAQQAKLLTVLQTRRVNRVGSNQEISVNIRLVCATNQPISGMAADADSAFRQDLLYRINTVEVSVPPLRNRVGDIPLLAQHFLEQYAEKYQKPQPALAESTLQYLQNYDWPGNVRELQHAIERAVILSNKPSIQPEDFSLGIPVNPLATEELPKTLDENERNFIKQALDRHQGNITHTAKELGITRTALYRRLEKFGL
ncbi:sigma-54-dependent transcriptional regulator [Tunicatimonas pelagia]|uniref:sigma-54-dependent transcriptional regulator n=1 Tax=Tunicatimonas pelagia TaxID=931531 RepID=UPI002665DF5B|nr:sigma-54 dependent transcriptional regulator [Tunicatimonas pelagia]WKN42943.1 sigma-54 dependent transcriptional regulator [Tunicatimonas pelagia]